MHALAIFERKPDGLRANWSLEPLDRNQATLAQAQAFDPWFVEGFQNIAPSAAKSRNEIQTTKLAFFAVILLPRMRLDDLDTELVGFPYIAPISAA
jgi:hypothetical protein